MKLKLSPRGVLVLTLAAASLPLLLLGLVAVLSPLWRVNSGQVFSYIASGYPITSVELARLRGRIK